MNNYIYENHNTKAFYNMAWITFALASIGMAAGLYYLEAPVSMKGFLIMSYIFFRFFLLYGSEGGERQT